MHGTFLHLSRFFSPLNWSCTTPSGVGFTSPYPAAVYSWNKPPSRLVTLPWLCPISHEGILLHSVLLSAFFRCSPHCSPPCRFPWPAPPLLAVDGLELLSVDLPQHLPVLLPSDEHYFLTLLKQWIARN